MEFREVDPMRGTHEKRKEWDDFLSKIQALRMEVNESAAEKMEEKEGFLFVHERISEFVESLRKNYALDELCGYASYHGLVGSGPVFENSSKLDFPEPYKVESFLENLIKELKKSTEA